jgi:hypothetical protein
MTKNRRIQLSVLASLGVLAVAVAASAAASDNPAPPSQPKDASTRIMSAIDSPRVIDLTSEGSTAIATGQASSSLGDANRSMWYVSVAGSAIAEADGLAEVTRTVNDEQTGQSLQSEHDAVSVEAPDPFEPTSLTEADVDSQVNSESASLDLQIREVKYIDLYGGGAEVVVQPSDLSAMLAHAGSTLHELLGPIGDDGHPYLVTVVDEKGAPQLVLGSIPGIGGTTKQGMAWAAPGVETDVIMGAPYVAPDSSP